MNKNRMFNILALVEFGAYLGFFVSLIFSVRAINSMSIGLIGLTGLLHNKWQTGAYFHKRMVNLFLGSSLLFYLLQLVSLVYSNNMIEGLMQLQLKSSLIFLPLALCCGYLNPENRRHLMISFVMLLCAATLYCLVVASVQFIEHRQIEVFFYYALVSPLFSQHAIQFSILMFMGLIFLLESMKQKLYLGNLAVHAILVLYFICVILLLSSKLIIGYTIISLIAYWLLIFNGPKHRKPVLLFGAAILLIFLLVLLTQNPVSGRFRDIGHGNVSLIEQKSFNPGVYFNGLQFRLLQWRFVKEILSDKKAWITGVGTGDAQALLDQKYISTNMYIGDRVNGQKGFLGYNAHNEFLQSILETGALGLLCFLVMCFAMVRMALKTNRLQLYLATAVLISYSCVESVLQTQYGIVIFIFFPLFDQFGISRSNQ